MGSVAFETLQKFFDLSSAQFKWSEINYGSFGSELIGGIHVSKYLCLSEHLFSSFV